MKYYLINNEIKKATSEMPNDESMFYKRKDDTQNWGDFLLNEWHSSLQPCSITERELEKITWAVTEPLERIIDVTLLINDNDGVITFKECERGINIIIVDEPNPAKSEETNEAVDYKLQKIIDWIELAEGEGIFSIGTSNLKRFIELL